VEPEIILFARLARGFLIGIFEDILYLCSRKVLRYG
jgi:hypothetical protein